nr:hypothetical protein CFP56_37456 [Quercus suber]
MVLEAFSDLGLGCEGQRAQGLSVNFGFGDFEFVWRLMGCSGRLEVAEIEHCKKSGCGTVKSTISHYIEVKNAMEMKLKKDYVMSSADIIKDIHTSKVED